MTLTSIEPRGGSDPATLPVGPSPNPRSWWHRRRALSVAAVSAVALVGLIAGAAVLPVPYVALRPGSVRPVSELVLIEGAPSYPPAQSIAFTTVSLGSTTLLEAFFGWVDDDVDVLPEDRVRGGRTSEENRRYNAQLMDTSKLVAITVALEHLGYTVPIRTTGTVVRQIVEGSPAEGALELDDVIVAVDGQPVDAPNRIGPLLQPGGPGASHVLTVERPAGSDTTLDVSINTMAAPDEPTRAVVGIAPEDRIVGFDFPIDVAIDSGDVGGPSAGLAFTLALIDVLTPGELTGGRRVAVTGTMSLSGAVGPVGGGAQKAVTVRNAGYDMFLVPSEEYEEVRTTVGDDLQVIAVDTLGDALDALASLGGTAGSLERTGGTTGS